MSEHKNKLIFAVAAVLITVILLGAVSYSFFPSTPNQQALRFGSVGVCIPMPAIVISPDGAVNSTALNQTGNIYRQTSDIINKTILVQKDNTVIDGAGFTLVNSQIKLQQESNVTIMNMQFTNSSSITLNETSNCLITRNTVAKTPSAIIEWLYLENSPNNVISANNLTTANIELMFSSNNTLKENNITDADSFGIIAEWSQNNTVSNNYFENILIPIEADYIDHTCPGNNSIFDNTMVKCNEGVRLLSDCNTVYGNNMTFAEMGYNQTKADWMTGIELKGSNNTVYKNNIFGYGLAGILLEGSNNTISENIVACNKYGLLVGFYGYNAIDNSTIYHNDFINNYQNAFVCSPQSAEANNDSVCYVNFWDMNDSGNYWSDYSQQNPNASNLNNTGIMDNPYIIDANNSDSYPLAQPRMQENISAYPKPYAGQTLCPYVICWVLPGADSIVEAHIRNCIYVEFYKLPPNVTLTLTPAVPIANQTTTLRSYTFNFAELLPASTKYSATITYGDQSNIQSYTWNFTTPSYT